MFISLWCHLTCVQSFRMQAPLAIGCWPALWGRGRDHRNKPVWVAVCSCTYRARQRCASLHTFLCRIADLRAFFSPTTCKLSLSLSLFSVCVGGADHDTDLSCNRDISTVVGFTLSGQLRGASATPFLLPGFTFPMAYRTSDVMHKKERKGEPESKSQQHMTSPWLSVGDKLVQNRDQGNVNYCCHSEVNLNLAWCSTDSTHRCGVRCVAARKRGWFPGGRGVHSNHRYQPAPKISVGLTQNIN